MCGIAGFIERSGTTADRDRLQRATKCIAYRGPDDEGLLVRGPVALGHRRLSIVDVSARGHQPMAAPDQLTWITYNGEIYNHPEIRARLTNPAPYASTSDTEVLVRACQELGPPCFASLNGIFSFAVLDERSRKVILARDHYGIKPLYYAIDADRFYFASEIKAILAAGFKPEFNPIAALDFVFTGWTADRSTLLHGIRRLPPGSFLTYDLGTGAFTVDRYYRPEPDWARADAIGARPDAWERAVEEGVHAAVESQLMSDVPVGTFCSGGIDSSLVTALAASRHKEILAFNVACPEVPELDEGGYARRVAAHAGIRLHTLDLNRRAFREAVVRTVHVTEYPLSFLNTVPLYLLSMLAREQGVKVLLTGEGADELFGGYVGQYRRNAVRRVAASKGPIGNALLGRALGLVESAGSKIGMTVEGGYETGMHTALIGGLRTQSIIDHAAKTYARYTDPLDRELAIELMRQLQSYLLPILHRTDRSTMAASIEARVPYLDPDLVGLALAVPPSLKVGVEGFKPVGKRILKKIAERYLPGDIVHRPKMGFAVPPAFFLTPWPRPWLEDGFVVTAFNLEPREFEAWIAQQRGQSACWMLTLEMWGQMFIRGRSPCEVSDEFLGATPA